MPAISTVPIYEIKITLRDIEPEPWRRVVVRADIPLSKFHMVIQLAMGWTNSHLHEFEARGQRFGMRLNDPFDHDPVLDERKVKLSEIAGPRVRILYRYDFGDGWEHEIKVEKVVAADQKTPRCIAGEFACPPDDCGGPWGYAGMLQTLAGPPCDEREELIEWLGGEFDPKVFDIVAANRRVARIKE